MVGDNRSQDDKSAEKIAKLSSLIEWESVIAVVRDIAVGIKLVRQPLLLAGWTQPPWFFSWYVRLLWPLHPPKV
jgi:hypothetical protein